MTRRLGASAIPTICLLLSQLVCAHELVERFWERPFPGQFNPATLAVDQATIRVQGNRFVDSDGNTFVFRGASIADPSKLFGDGRWDRRIFEALQAWGANTVRLPVHPSAWRLRGKEAYLALIDDAVRWCNELGMYLIIDWHSIGYLPTELFPRDAYRTTRRETLSFWREVTFRYQGVQTVAVYELFNEPTKQGDTPDRRDWNEWKEFNEQLIDLIRARDKEVIPLVAGFNWAYDLRGVRRAPIDRDRIAYAAHPYPQKANPEVPSKENFFAAWDEVWGFVAEDYPMILSEIGWVREGGKGAHVPVINDGSYGPMIIEYIERKGLSWIAWVFDPDWSPVLITDWNFTPSEQGAFFRGVMQAPER